MDGVEVEADVLKRQISETERQLQGFLSIKPETRQALDLLFATSPSGISITSPSGLTRFLEEWKLNWQWNKEKRLLAPETRKQVEQLEKLLRKRRVLQRQVSSLATARRALALWHTIHIPIGMVLFTAAFIHIAAAIYFATLLR
jgi:hypothetical protein